MKLHGSHSSLDFFFFLFILPHCVIYSFDEGNIKVQGYPSNLYEKLNLETFPSCESSFSHFPLITVGLSAALQRNKIKKKKKDKECSTAMQCVCCCTLAARHLTASFLCAVVSPVPGTALWLGWESLPAGVGSGGWLEAAFPCLSPPGQSMQQQAANYSG